MLLHRRGVPSLNAWQDLLRVQAFQKKSCWKLRKPSLVLLINRWRTQDRKTNLNNFKKRKNKIQQHHRKKNSQYACGCIFISRLSKGKEKFISTDISKKQLDFCKDHDIIRKKRKPVRIDNLTFSKGRYGQNGKSGLNFASQWSKYLSITIGQ